MRLVLFGMGGHAKMIAEAIRAKGDHEIVGVINEDGRAGELLPGIKAVGSNETALQVVRELRVDGAVIALGDATLRQKIDALVGGKLAFPAIVHPAAWVSPSSTLGDGAVIMAGAIVGASTVIGRHCIINTNASVDHDCIVGDYTQVCPGAAVGGYATLGRNVWVGMGAVVVDRVTIADDTFIKSMALVARPRLV